MSTTMPLSAFNSPIPDCIERHWQALATEESLAGTATHYEAAKRQ